MLDAKILFILPACSGSKSGGEAFGLLRISRQFQHIIQTTL